MRKRGLSNDKKGKKIELVIVYLFKCFLIKKIGKIKKICFSFFCSLDFQILVFKIDRMIVLNSSKFFNAIKINHHYYIDKDY